MNKSCQIYSYQSDKLHIEKESLEKFLSTQKISSLEKDYVHWLNFHDLTDRVKIEEFFDEQGFAKLTVEDIYTAVKRPKLEEYESYLFFSIKSALPSPPESLRLQKEQISFILGKNYLISLQEKSSDHFTEVRERIEQKKGVIRDKGPDFLLYRLLDAIVDNYFEVLEHTTNVINHLNTKLTQSNSPEMLNRIELQKSKLAELRKIVFPLKEIALKLESSEHELLLKDNHHYFVDLKDNCMSILDEIDSNKSVLEGMSNLYYAIQGQRMNEIMKVLTVVSTIFIPLTFIVGVYGMNFIDMPELKMKDGYLYVWVLMIVVAIALVLFFVKKGWLRNK